MAQFKTIYWKIRNYYRHHGVKHTALRMKEALRRRFFVNREILFYMDLADWLPGIENDHPYTIHRIRDEAEIPETWRNRILEHLPPEVYVEHMKKRFAKGASIWCLKKEEELIGFLWAFIGGTMRPHYFPLLPFDVHIFDGFIFPQHRGQDINALMMTLVMEQLKKMGLRRAYVETMEWNTPARRALEKMQFRPFGLADQRFRKGKTIVTWWVD